MIFVALDLNEPGPPSRRAAFAVDYFVAVREVADDAEIKLKGGTLVNVIQPYGRIMEDPAQFWLPLRQTSSFGDAISCSGYASGLLSIARTVKCFVVLDVGAPEQICPLPERYHSGSRCF